MVHGPQVFPVADTILQNSLLYCIMYVQEFDLIKL